jgi:hypothetical protein
MLPGRPRLLSLRRRAAFEMSSEDKGRFNFSWQQTMLRVRAFPCLFHVTHTHTHEWVREGEGKKKHAWPATPVSQGPSS